MKTDTQHQTSLAELRTLGQGKARQVSVFKLQSTCTATAFCWVCTTGVPHISLLRLAKQLASSHLSDTKGGQGVAGSGHRPGRSPRGGCEELGELQGPQQPLSLTAKSAGELRMGPVVKN